MINITTLIPDFNPNTNFRSNWGYAAEPKNGGFDIYVYGVWGGLYVFEITNNSLGLQLQHEINLSNIDAIFQNPVNVGDFSFEEFESRRLSNGNTRLAGTTYYQGNDIVFIIELNPLNQYINGSLRYKIYSAPNNSERARITGLEFSKNGEYLYITHETNSLHTEPIEYFHYPTSSTGALNVSGKNDFKRSYIEIKGDSIYFVTGNRMALLKSSNAPSVSNWSNNEIPFASFAYQPVGFNQKFVLPDQIDFYDYISLYSQPTCCREYRAYDVQNFTIPVTAHNQVWEPGGINGFNTGNAATLYVNGVLRIPEGVTITLKNFVLKFNDTSYVEIARGNTPFSAGGKLILENCVLTSDERCGLDTTWRGVQVLGYPTRPQGPVLSSSQGALIMRNTTIEKAIIGAYATRLYTSPSASLQVNDSFNGGIIQAVNSQFINNKIDVMFRKYNNFNPNTGNALNNVSVFTNSNFITRGKVYPLSAVLPYPIHAMVWETDGIRFRGCDFRNDSTQHYTLTTRGMGIWASNARIVAEGLCPTPLCNSNVDSTRFVQLGFGVFVSNANGQKNTRIERSVFNNVWRGATLRNSNNSMVVNNRYAVTQYTLGPQTNSYGLFLNTCTGYTVEGNLFHHFVDATVPGAVENTYGVIVENSGSAHNEVYRNRFYNLRVGGQAQLVNASPYVAPNYSQVIGLQWLCNEFNSTIDFADLVTASGRIAYNQGTCPTQLKKPAGNRFSHDNIDFAGSFSVEFSSNYNHHNDLITTPIVYDNQALTPITNCNISYTSNYCSPKYKGNINLLPALMQTRADITQQWQTERNKIDGGNTAALLQAIQSNMAHGPLRNLLLGHAPFLSEAVLLAYLNKAGVPPGHYQQVLLACSPLTSPVRQAVQQKSLPAGIKNQILAAQQGISPLENQYQYIAALYAEKSNLLKEIMHEYVQDTTAYKLNEMIALLEDENQKEYFPMLGYLYLEKQDSVKLFDLLVAMEHEGEYANYVRWLSLLWSIRNADALCKAVISDPGKKIETEDIAYDTDESQKLFCAGAQNLLMQMGETFFIEQVELVTPTNQARMAGSEETQTELMPWAELPVYPNPTRDVLYVNLPAVEEGHEITVQLINLNGQVVMQQRYAYGGLYAWNLEQVPVGMYLVQMSVNGELWMGQKVMVAR